MKLRLALFLLIVFSVSTLYSQVTIGKDETAVSGSLLQLKDNGNYTNNQTASKGLGMPRVKLTDMKNLYPMFAVDPDSDTPQPNNNYNSTAKKRTQDEMHTGLVVYNTNDCLNHMGGSTGVQVWDGTTWGPLSSGTTSTVTGRSGKVYKTAVFGSAGEWMVENLAETVYDTESPVAGTSIPIGMEGLDASNNHLKAYYFPKGDGDYTGVVADDRQFYDQYKDYGLGLMYSWAAATNDTYYNTVKATDISPDGPDAFSDVQGICPNGWRIPSDRDWLDLEKQIASHPQLYSTETTPITWDPNVYEKRQNLSILYRGSVSKNMKSPCIPAGYTNTLPTGGISTGSGFNVLLAGFINNKIINYPETIGAFWSSSNYDGSDVSINLNVWVRVFYNAQNGVGREGAGIGQLQSVRCVKARK